MPDFTEIFSDLNDLEKELELDEIQGELFLTKGGSNLGLALPSGWTPPEKRDFRAAGGKKFYEISIMDVAGEYSQRLAVCDGIKYNGRGFKVTDKDSPIGATREWILELQPLGASPAA